MKYSLLQFFRNKQSVFFTFVFPALLLLVLGYLLGGQPGSVTLYYVDNDGSQASKALIGLLSTTGGIDLRDGSGMDLARSLTDGGISAYLEIPPGFGESVASGKALALTMYYDRSKPSAPAVVQRAVDQFNHADAKGPVALGLQDVATSGTGYVGFLLPGILGMCIMFTALNQTIGVISRYRANGVFSKLSVTPMSTIEWNLSMILTGTVVVLLSVAVALGAAWLAFGVLPAIDILSILLVVSGAIMFVGLGMIVAYALDDVVSPNAVSLIITLPLMVVSGSLFPVDQLPYLVRFLAVLSPLTPLNNGLRSAMFTGNYGDALGSLFIGIGLGLILFAIGVAILMGKEGQDV